MTAFSTYEEHYTNVQSLISTKQAMYERVALLNNIDENLSLNDDDALDGSTDDIDQTEISAKYGCFNPIDKSLHQSYDLGIDLGIRKSVVGVNVVSEALLPESIYRETIRSLNKEQKCIFYHISHWFKVNTNEPLYAFLSGGTGVGKSVTTRAICPDDVKILICAPTGKAAHNIGGNTLHAAFHIPANQSFSYKPLDMQQLNTLRSKYAALSVVFIDGISIVGNRMFNYISMRLQEVKGNLKSFGGVSITAIGVLYQLKPVMDGWIFLNIKAGYGPLGSNLWIDHFLMYELQTIMRQKDDKIFAEFLNRLREGNHTNDDLRMIKKRAVNNRDPRSLLADETLPHLFTTRREVFVYNEKIYCETNNAKCKVEAVDSVCGDMTIEISQKILDRIPNDSSKTMVKESTLCLAENIPVEVCVNIEVEDGLTIGASCLVRKFDYRVEGSERCSIVWVEFNDRNVAPAKTIHKSQGTTMPEGAVIDFGNRKTDHIHYIGLRRVQNMSKIVILNLNEEKISTSIDAKGEMERLRSKTLPLSIPNLSQDDREHFTVAYHNIRSLYLHMDDLPHEYDMKNVDVLVLSETRLKKMMQMTSSVWMGLQLFGMTIQCLITVDHIMA
ncbi:unnamed protein product [Mytilus coruscus]|uniref:ATP-dependent DNA helicase n=1 Tax=Mytilus coruscus TaxID=42192 RepID=A0A6J8AN43_MYTCO|nr:unnamed protein product [Mytilus coruscus]